MADTIAVLAGRIATLERLVRDLSRTSRLANSSIENGAITVYDDGGDLRGSIGLQPDGTLAVAAVNGPPPPVPGAPTITSVLGGVAVVWDGSFAGGTQAPADFAYVEVHSSTAPDFPDDGSLFSAFYSAQGGTMTVPAATPVWVRLVCVSTSGVVSDPSPVAGPAGPTPVVAQAVLDGIINELALADDAVTRAKIAAAAVGKTEIADGSITTPKLVVGELNGDRLAVGTMAANVLIAASITAAQIKALSLTGDLMAVNTLTADKFAAGTITAASGVISSIDASKIVTGIFDASKATIKNLDASAINAGTINVDRLSVGLQGQVGQKFYDFGDSAAKWSESGTGSMTTVAVTDAQSGGSVMRCVGYIASGYRPDVKIPFDPSVTYRVSVRVRQTVANGTPGTNQRFYAGVAGLAADGVTWVNISGANSSSNHFYVAADAQNLTSGAGWVTYTGFIKGTSAAPVGGVKPNANAPGQLHAGVRYITPIVFVNHTGGSGTAEIDMFAIEVVEMGALTASNVVAGAIDGQVITGATVQTAKSGARLALSGNRFFATDATGKVLAEIVPDDGSGRSAYFTYDTRLGLNYYAGLTAGDVRFGISGQTDPQEEAGVLYSFLGGGLYELLLRSGADLGNSAAEINLYSETGPVASDSEIVLSADRVTAPGRLTAGNMAFGSVNITPSAADTPTSFTVSGLHVAGSTFRAFVSANTTVPGTSVTGVGATSVSATGVTVWLTRANTNTTTVYWMVVGS
ncbi:MULTISPECIES: hypothetical protein [unclassified Streptomyces]|uniref:hypothetical protein n=1 Tax=unclassified Streptomyces TaxID=2593676 RepID=UPI0029B59504|nr:MULTISPECIES: hypothetical protein [unclassified Streptomyces]MDX3766415.1 hypothetical protein [Streptomyces sp. AK08-01B]MDX3816328.1 hypothetical protein [Streptomyces sp. AK08-01A]